MRRTGPRLFRCLLLAVAALLVVACWNTKFANIRNSTNAELVIGTQSSGFSYSWYRLPAGATARLGCTAECGDVPIVPPDHVLIMTSECDVIADVPQEQLETGTLVINVGQTVTFDPDDKRSYSKDLYDYGRIFEPCSQQIPTPSPGVASAVPQSSAP